MDVRKPGVTTSESGLQTCEPWTAAVALGLMDGAQIPLLVQTRNTRLGTDESLFRRGSSDAAEARAGPLLHLSAVDIRPEWGCDRPPSRCHRV